MDIKQRANVVVGINIVRAQSAIQGKSNTDNPSKSDILDYEFVQRWLRNVQGNSVRLYTRYFREFCQLVKLTPDEVLAKDQKDVHDLAKQFFQHLESQALSSWTCTLAYAAVRSFMKWNDKQLGPMPEKFAGHVQYESDRILQPQEVAKLIDHASTVRSKAIISFLHQSAQRAGILTALKYGDIRTQIEKGINPIVIDIIMHIVEKDGNGQPTIHSVVSNPPKLREAVGPDVVQQAEERAHKTPKTAKPSPKDEMTELDHNILQALDALGGKDVASIDMAKKVGTVKTHPDAPRAPIRRAMEAFEKLGYVKAEKKGAKYLFSITEKGKHYLLSNPTAPKEVKDSQAKDKGANPAPASHSGLASTASAESIRPPNTDIECPKCHTSNPFHAEYCKSCGTLLRAVNSGALLAS